MTKQIMALLFGAGLAALPTGEAEASCFFNTAICQAICNRDCCDGGISSLATPGRSNPLARFSTADLQAEVDAHDGQMTETVRYILQEIERRGEGPTGRMSTPPASNN